MTAVSEAIRPIRSWLREPTAVKWLNAELYDWIYHRELELIKDAEVSEYSDTSITTVAGTRSYAEPSRTFRINRVFYNNKQLIRKSWRWFQGVTGNSGLGVTTRGTPDYYFRHAATLFCHDIPDAAQTLMLHTIRLPVLATTDAGVLTVPDEYIPAIVFGAAADACRKANNPEFMQKAVQLEAKWAELHAAAVHQFRQKEYDEDFPESDCPDLDGGALEFGSIFGIPLR